MKHVICVADREAEYAADLMSAVNERKTCPFAMVAFSSEEALLQYFRQDICDILLICAELYTEAVQKAAPEHVLLLSEGREAPDGPARELPVLYKYQKTEHLIRQILERYDQDSAPFCSKNTTRLIAVYSPVHRIGKTLFALALGQELAKQSGVLYLNLESMSGFEAFFEEMPDADVTDLLYYAKQEEAFPGTRIGTMTGRIHGMDYIPPAVNPAELVSVPAVDWLNLFVRLKETGLYDVILLDPGDALQGLLDILDLCDEVYMPVASDPVSAGKIGQYEQMLERLSYTALQAKTEKITLPQPEFRNGASMYAGELLWGPFATYARSVLEGAGQ